jgi:hypothetical protein
MTDAVKVLAVGDLVSCDCDYIEPRPSIGEITEFGSDGLAIVLFKHSVVATTPPPYHIEIKTGSSAYVWVKQSDLTPVKRYSFSDVQVGLSKQQIIDLG